MLRLICAYVGAPGGLRLADKSPPGAARAAVFKPFGLRTSFTLNYGGLQKEFVSWVLAISTYHIRNQK